MYAKSLKRVLDFVIALLALPFILLSMLILGPIIYFTDRGPIFYNAPRLGKDGRVFKMFKFRSMKVNAPDLRNADGSTFNAADDPRVTKIGRLMRKTSLDELPQFLNVLKGDMSLVGPRAHLTTHYESFAQLDPLHQKRLAVRPGITGYNQAYFRNSVSAEEKVANDVYYVEHLSFALDVKILVQTVVSVLKHDNIYVKPAAQPEEAKAPVSAGEEKR